MKRQNELRKQIAFKVALINNYNTALFTRKTKAFYSSKKQTIMHSFILFCFPDAHKPAAPAGASLSTQS